jgi:hypothetical protein
MVGRVTPTILAMDAFETCFCKRRRISSSFPSSRDFPSTPFGRPSSRPLARADANPSRGRSEIKSLDLGEQAEQGNHNLGLQVLLSIEVDAFLDGSEADFTLHQFIDDVNHLSQATPETR